MARRPTGSVVAPGGQRKSWAIRFQAYGKRQHMTLGLPDEGWDHRKAQDELDNILADVRRGLWRPFEPKQEALPDDPSEMTFAKFALDWLEGVGPTLKPRTQEEYGWRLKGHLMPFFAAHRLSEITIREVDRYRLAKLRAMKVREAARIEQLKKPMGKRGHAIKPFSQGSINKTISLLAMILDQAIEYGYLDRNAARGRKRLLKEPKPSRTYLQPEQVTALLNAAGEIDRGRRSDDNRRRLPMLAVLTLAGLRIGEALNLRWRDVSLAKRKLWVREAKTHAGVREVDLSPALKDILSEYKAGLPRPQPSDYVFITNRGGQESAANVRHRFLTDAVALANEALHEAGSPEIGKITPHSLRRTFISLLLAAGADVPYVMAQAGHSDPKVTLGLYAKVIATQTDFGAALDQLASTSQLAHNWQSPKTT